MGRKINLTENQENKIIDFYLSPNSIKSTAKHFGYSEFTIDKILVKNNIPKHSKEVTKQIFTDTLKDINLKKYGVDSYFKTDEFKTKSSATKISKYGTACYNNPEKRKTTCIARYGVEHPLQEETIKQKQVNTMQNLYGVQNYAVLEECKNKIKSTNLKKYGVDNYSKTSLFIKKTKTTCLKKFGVDNYSKTEEFKKDFANNVESIKMKSYNTKKHNHSFNISKPENDFYLFLVEVFGKENVIRQYKDSRYPFSCDFYIKSEDLFIELNLHWSHGCHPFDQNNKNDLNKLELWAEKAKTSKYYKNAIKVWTELDLNKQRIAKENNLNYLAIYSMKEAYEVINNLYLL